MGIINFFRQIKARMNKQCSNCKFYDKSSYTFPCSACERIQDGDMEKGDKVRRLYWEWKGR